MTGPRYDVRRDRILFVDVEMTCWDGPPPLGESPEIIEFGLAEVDVSTLEVTRSVSLLVRPARSRVSAYCEALTGISEKSLRAKGRPLREVVATMRKNWGTGSKAWMAWGSDRRAVDRDCAAVDVDTPFSASFHDLGLQFGLMLGSSGGIGLEDAIGLLGVERHGNAHSGEGDAVTTAIAWIAMAREARARLAPAAALPPPIP